LDQLTPIEFTPDLTILDSVITSLHLETGDGSCGGISSIP
jgi:hypothetical protein